MYVIEKQEDLEKSYQMMVNVARSMIEDERDIIANMANISAVINAYMEDLNWVGFYRRIGEELVLGPFQGMPACIRIKLGKGVCGTAAREQRTVLVKNVHEFPGHIACDSKTNSEIVIPIYQNGEVFGVLDLDSPILERFSQIEQRYLEEISLLLSKSISSISD